MAASVPDGRRCSGLPCSTLVFSLPSQWGPPSPANATRPDRLRGCWMGGGPSCGQAVEFSRLHARSLSLAASQRPADTATPSPDLPSPFPWREAEPRSRFGPLMLLPIQSLRVWEPLCWRPVELLSCGWCPLNFSRGQSCVKRETASRKGNDALMQVRALVIFVRVDNSTKCEPDMMIQCVNEG